MSKNAREKQSLVVADRNVTCAVPTPVSLEPPKSEAENCCQDNHACPEGEIRELAYAKWQAANCPPGDGVNFWLEAEAELLAKQG